LCFFCDKKGHYKSNFPERLALENAKTKKESKEYTAAVFDEDAEDFDKDGVGFYLLIEVWTCLNCGGELSGGA